LHRLSTPELAWRTPDPLLQEPEYRFPQFDIQVYVPQAAQKLGNVVSRPRVNPHIIAVGTLVSQRPPHRSGRARQGIRLLPSVRRPSELSPHKRRLAHRRGREASCDTLTWRSVQYVLRIPFLPLAPVLPSTDSAEVATPHCSPASAVL
jgi:hypothetical protein